MEAGRPTVKTRAKAQKPRARFFSDEEKAEAIARIKAGESVHAVARSLAVQPSTVRQWRAKFHPEADPQQEKDYAALVLRHLELGLAAAERILSQTGDAAWLGKQSAGELATFYGVIFDKQARILAALPSQYDPEPERLPPPAGDPDGGVVADTLGGTTAS